MDFRAVVVPAASTCRRAPLTRRPRSRSAPKATYDNGVLEVSIALAEEKTAGRRITVETASWSLMPDQTVRPKPDTAFSSGPGRA
ncbi:hypothetical protein Psi01_68820 [Planobispora siamensis]|uniref:Hsp20/alpha crystallin family protein n=1 Tax=Planobispora siamensis TaxID=936338 RepID=A0A8J3SNX6_9ACTN|nr:hypothetical protein Psi01_68820 [Planobispora siamensis]